MSWSPQWSQNIANGNIVFIIKNMYIDKLSLLFKKEMKLYVV